MPDCLMVFILKKRYGKEYHAVSKGNKAISSHWEAVSSSNRCQFLTIITIVKMINPIKTSLLVFLIKGMFALYHNVLSVAYRAFTLRTYICV